MPWVEPTLTQPTPSPLCFPPSTPLPSSPPCRKSFLSLFTRKALSIYIELQDGIIRRNIDKWLERGGGAGDQGRNQVRRGWRWAPGTPLPSPWPAFQSPAQGSPLSPATHCAPHSTLQQLLRARSSAAYDTEKRTGCATMGAVPAFPLILSPHPVWEGG